MSPSNDSQTILFFWERNPKNISELRASSQQLPEQNSKKNVIDRRYQHFTVVRQQLSRGAICQTWCILD
eukprot:COSAG01_NODE_51563_length_354_cov_0.270588_1_plen_68_part_01